MMKLISKLFSSNAASSSERDDLQDAIESCFTGGPRFDTGVSGFKCNFRQCEDIAGYLEDMATYFNKKYVGADEGMIRTRCEPAMKEFCRAILEAKLFLQDCSVQQADFSKIVKSITKMDTGEAYEVLLHDLIWSKAGLDLAILLPNALVAADNQIIINRVDECTSRLSTYTSPAYTQPLLNWDRVKLYRSFEKPRHEQQLYSDETQKKCLSFLVQKSKAYHEKLSQATDQSGDAGGAQQLHKFKIDPLDIGRLEEGNMIGEGSYGNVYRSSWLGDADVAVKVFKLRAPQTELFKKEISLLADLQNPFIVHMVGWCEAEKGKKCWLVTELAQTDLKEVIDCRATLTVHAAVDIMLQISKGMEYLHKKKVIHRDIKPGNVLLERSPVKRMAAEGHARVKLCDFGLAKVKQLTDTDQSLYTTVYMGTSYYRAPEVLVDEAAAAKYTRQADVFSFAILCSEILAGWSATSCYTAIRLSREALRKKMLENVRPSLPADYPSHLVDLIRRCWDTDHKRRPTFERVSNTLTYIKFILMRVSSVERAARLYDSVVIPFDEDELRRRVSEDGDLKGGETYRTSTGEKEQYSIINVEEAGESSNNMLEKPVVELQAAQQGTRSCLIMKSGQFLRTHQSIMCDGYKFVMQEKGMLVLYTPPDAAAQSRALWASQTRRDEDCSCVLEEDGNLVIYGSKGTRQQDDVVWSSNSSGSKDGSYRLELEVELEVVRAVIRGDEGRIWATDESVERRSMKSGQFLGAHQWMLSKGHKLMMQGDGNLVLCNPSGKALWASGTIIQGAVCICKLEEDGNLVIYDTRERKVVWSSGSRGTTKSFYKLELEGDGGRAVIAGPQCLLWATTLT